MCGRKHLREPKRSFVVKRSQQAIHRMPISLDKLVSSIVPGKTTLLLGAGASASSGAPMGASLAHHLWMALTGDGPKSDDLMETATVLARRYGRRAVIEEIGAKLRPLKPAGGLLGLVQLGWPAIFSTNFDELVEKAFRQSSIPLCTYRSNYDFSNKDDHSGVKFHKIHGCITQDESLGHKASMVLTEEDYEVPDQFRQTMFANLSASFLNGDVLVIGQSLRDRHLNDLVKKVLAAKPQGAPGHLYVLIYDEDDLRAPLLEDKGARVAFGGLEDFVHAVANGRGAVAAPVPVAAPTSLPLSIVSATRDVALEARKDPNVVRMFNGGPAGFPDIRAGATFERARYEVAAREIVDGRFLTVITGAAGVGKTTFARQLVLSAMENGCSGWEHAADFGFQWRPWLAVEAQLRADGARGILFVDECTHYLRQINELVDALSEIDEPALSLVLTANAAQWVPRIKTPNIFKHGHLLELGRLEQQEISSLINLLESNREISALVHLEFRRKSRQQKADALRQRCSADMFVCLNNIFASENLDTILLQEYEQLSENYREYYRYVSALQAVGARVHRQLIIRMLGMPPAQVSAALEGLHGIVDEYDIRPEDGIYGWTTRHLVIARKIADYKFSGLKELVSLFDAIIDHINPSISVELQSVRDICDADFGIGRLGDASERRRLYGKLIDVAPGERIPWHRLIRELLSAGELDTTEYIIRDAEEAVGRDAPIDRFKVRLLINRANKTPGISDSDRIAILRKAYEVATKNIGAHRWDKFSYSTLCDVAVLLVQKGESEYLLNEAIERMKEAAERIQDPEMQRQIRHYQELRLRTG